MQQSKAAEIPEELFEHIIWYACDTDGAAPLQRDVKRAVAACASVCRYWARLARRELFRYVTLRTLDDVRRFHAIVDTPPVAGLEPVAELVWRLNAAPDSRSTPWLHLVFLRVLAALRADITLRVNTLPSDGRPWRSLHPALPRTLPGSIMALEELDVSGVRFPDGRTLARLLGSLPRLATLAATSPTFDVQPTAHELAVPPFGLHLSHVATNDHALGRAFVPRLLANTAPMEPSARIRGGRIAQYILAEDDIATVNELFRLFGAAPSIEVYHYCDKPWAATQSMHVIELFPYDQDTLDEYGKLVAPTIQLYLTSGLEQRAVAPAGAAAPRAESITLYVHTVQVHLTSLLAECAEKFCSETLWKSFCETALKLTHLQRVEVVRDWDLGSYDWFAALGLTDEAFGPLVKRKRFGCRFLSRELDTMSLGTAIPKEHIGIRAADSS